MKIYLENFGPFEKVDLELRKLTIFIGRNSVGKSMLSYLICALSSAEPNFEDVKEGWENFNKISEKVAEQIMNGEISRKDFEDLIKAFYENVVREAVRIGLEENFIYTFGTGLREIVKIGKDKAVIEVHDNCAKLKLSLTDKLSIEEFDLCLENLLKNIEVKVPRKGYLHVKYNKDWKEFRIASSSDIMEPVLDLLAYHIIKEFEGIVLVTPFYTSLLPDSRAGITRTLLKPYIPPSLLAGVLGVDQDYVKLYFRLSEWLYKNPKIVDEIKPMLEELGVTLESRFEYGVYNIYVKTWSGKSTLIATAPSGIREVLSVILALMMKEAGGGPSNTLHNIIIEEPEAHLHPRAQKVFVRIVAKAVNAGKNVIITTHSDYLISALNNLILLSRLPEDKCKELGYSKEEILSPDDVVAYLVKVKDDKAIVERLQITEDGIPEDEFGKIAEELLEERGKIYEKVQASKS
jgi:predicted ATPase